MQNYRIHRKHAQLGRRQSSGIGKIVLIVVVVIAIFIGARMLLSKSSSDTSDENDNEIQTLESLLENVNVPLSTGTDQEQAATASNAVACDTQISSITTQEKIVALTIDSGGIVTHADQILDTLESEQVPAVFFLTGTFADDHADIVKKIADKGFIIGNHSNDHTDFTTISAEAVTAQIADAKSKIERAAGKSMANFVRPPKGLINETVLDTIKQTRNCTIKWSIDAEDWEPNSTVETIVANIDDNLSAGDIIMIQFGHETIAEALPTLIANVRTAGYQFVDLTKYISFPQSP